MYQIVLASGSPRRKEILSQVGINFTVCVSNMEEITSETLPENIVMELSKMKAHDIAKQYETNTIIIGSDTIVAYKNQILGKPKNEDHAKEMLQLLSGVTHEVYTGVTVIIKNDSGEVEERTFFEISKVTVSDLTEEEIMDYIKSKEPMDKAGAYAVQGRFAAHVTRIEGDYYTIVGLPIARLYQEVKKFGIDLVKQM
ncbi:Maf family protein [Lachnoclostridium phytofermentans]|uniref:dTTP/UTP pyrophosphatase n=1 Tax=Lachnoclostridium phytofermentans (strain ATCC 700394 / DSM 18823 / ISDg) TaxID=357809 RepID=NTPPA_LACP7|nr:Maf family protein [Lachnoclostridium phytofermentans]A9KHL6.1 RecName: Full=dTTP/UTP pyrophosphatase; Short=dTTPase/UTPase; AltName: Full=Nucleoside triphosphate pyrophosphatase; AltName: Full=Nucleotide pyrophosphatase; Short=Nucleotide PPase [Lachnoclostridium phytofermentans ISDg]ABX42301.1 maf protein [Lachnoclostridium phytofermentans ISDg]